MTRHPEIRVQPASHNPFALVAAVREELRRANIERSEIREFSSAALTQPSPLDVERVCRAWVEIVDRAPPAS